VVVSLSRERRLIEQTLVQARQIVDDVTAALKANDSPALRGLRGAAASFAVQASSALDRHTEDHGELTPVAVPTSKSSSNFQAVGRILDDANKGRPLKDEP
jgi:hypothetical protein